MPNTVRNLSRVSDLGVVGEWWVAGRRTHKGKGTHVKTPTTPFILMLEYEQSANSTGKGENPGRVFAGSLFFTAGVILLFLSHYSY